MKHIAPRIALFSLIANLCFALSAGAAVTVVKYWPMGEIDPGATAGAAASNTFDMISGEYLTCAGQAFYSSDVSTAAAAQTGSSLSIDFTNGAYAVGEAPTNLTDNFGIECWVKLASVNNNNQVIVYNGSTATSGWGLFVTGGNYSGLYGGHAIFGSAPATANVWTHLALVRTNGLATLYTNGVAAATSAAGPAIPSGNFAVATDPQSPGQESLTGWVDEVRVFAITNGQVFTTSDLLLSQNLVHVTSSADSGAGSLRAMVASAASGAVIDFAPSLSGHTITLSSGPITLTNNVTIEGFAAPNGIQINGNSNSCVLVVSNGAAAILNSLTITNGYDDTGNFAGGILNDGTLTINNCAITGNTEAEVDLGGGGGIQNSGGALIVNNSIFSKNTAIGGDGGGGGAIDIYLGTVVLNQCALTANSTSGDGSWGGAVNNSSGTLTLNYCALSGNSAGDRGGGIFSAGGGASLALNNCTLFGNIATNTGGGTDGGGGIFNFFSPLTLNNCTIEGNSMTNGDGGGIYNGGGATLTVNNCTIASNSVTAGNGGGILITNGGTLNLTNTIVAANTASLSNDIAGAFTGSNNLTNDIPLLAPLGYYGGPTETMPPLAGSPAIDGGTDSVTNLFTTDQRGYPRSVGGTVDIGSVEGVVLAAAVVTGAATDASLNSAVLNGTVNPENAATSYYFEYGTTTGYGSFTAGNNLAPGANSIAVSFEINDLPAAAFYHFQLVASNYLGLSYGGDVVFHTGGTTDPITSTNDDGAVGTLRYVAANASEDDIFTFAPGLSGEVILLTNGQITLANSVTIDGSALVRGIQINGNSNSCVFVINNGVTAVFDSLTVTNGFDNTGNFAGGILNNGTLTLNKCIIAGNTENNEAGAGGGIYNNGALTATNCTVSGNSAPNTVGGAIFNGGTLTLANCTLSGNSATYDGGGIFNSGTVTVNNCTLSANSVTPGNDAGGGGIFNSGTLTANNCTLSGNMATNSSGGGGIFNNSTLTANDCTLSGNSAPNGDGGGICNEGGGTMAISQCTLTGNSATEVDGGGGIYNFSATVTVNNCTISSNSATAGNGGGILNTNGGFIYLTNTIVAGNTAPASNNVAGPFTGLDDLTNSDPLLAPLGFYGGTTETMPPLFGSPAIDAGTDSVTSLYATDQRGYPRLSGTSVDIGAVETQVPTLVLTAPASGTTFSNFNITASGTANCASGVAGVFVMDTGGGFIPAATSNNWSNWTADVTLANGTNTISAYAVNSNGVPSLTNSVVVDLPLETTNRNNRTFAQLLVQISPAGTLNKVSPNDNGKLLLIGSHITLTPVPGHNQIFSNWLSGTNPPYTVSTNSALKFIMESNMVVEANFVTNVFLPMQGSYYGLFAPTNAPRQQTNSGSITFTVTSAGSMSGKVNIAGASTAISGKFDLAGVVTNVAKRHGLSNLTNILQLDYANQLATGTVSDGGFTSTILANLNVFSSKDKATNFEGQYTLIIAGSTNPAVGPFGDSVGTVKISSTGTVTFAGNLADGTAVSGSSAIARDGVWPLYLSLYRGNGSFWSWNLFDSNGIVSSNEVPVTQAAPSWINGGNTARTALYPAGFTNVNAVTLGSAYSPTNHPVLADLNGDSVILDGGNLLAPQTNTVALRGAVESNNVVLTFTKTTGAVSGTFLDPVTGRKTKVTGVLLQGQSNVAGFFLGTNASGEFLIAP